MIFSLKITQKVALFSYKCSVVVRGFKIRDTLTERIYRKLQGPAVQSNTVMTKSTESSKFVHYNRDIVKTVSFM